LHFSQSTPYKYLDTLKVFFAFYEQNRIIKPSLRCIACFDMVDVAQSAERQVVVLDVVGSTPTIHPSFLSQISLKAPIRGPHRRKKWEQNQLTQSAIKNLQINKKRYTLLLSLNYLKYSGCGAIGSALALGARGCQFESGHPDHFLKEMYDTQSNIMLITCFYSSLSNHRICFSA
jgi:hypothetical protein